MNLNYEEKAEELCRGIYSLVYLKHGMNLPKDRREDISKIIKDALNEAYENGYNNGHSDGYHEGLGLV